MEIKAIDISFVKYFKYPLNAILFPMFISFDISATKGLNTYPSRFRTPSRKHTQDKTHLLYKNYLM